MKRLAIALPFLIVLCSLGGCRNVGTQSAFMGGFSIASVIEANEQHLIAAHTVSSGTVSEPPVPFFQMDEVAIVQADATKVPAFMEAVRSDIEEALTGSGAEIVGRGGDHPEHIEKMLTSQGLETRGPSGDRQGQEVKLADIRGFSFRYRDGQADGAINVWGVRGEGTTLILIVLITES